MAVSLGNLGTVASQMGNYEKAEELIRQALDIREQIAGSDSVSSAQLKHNLSVVLSRQAKNGEAEPLAASAFGIRRKELGPGHKSTNSSWLNLTTIRVALKGQAENPPEK